jgi:hypothetical protein
LHVHLKIYVVSRYDCPCFRQVSQNFKFSHETKPNGNRHSKLSRNNTIILFIRVTPHYIINSLFESLPEVGQAMGQNVRCPEILYYWHTNMCFTLVAISAQLLLDLVIHFLSGQLEVHIHIHACICSLWVHGSCRITVIGMKQM